ncbi:unnamed protein product [Rhizoctonia solani]|uniref:Uncharacterized protein n=1 Tax=Rhizoctonia solani TaxID=456999 RepID=A0A8H3BBB8_9AGAM|nr:unnamed protein product [Rhizoctonia solani]
MMKSISAIVAVTLFAVLANASPTPQPEVFQRECSKVGGHCNVTENCCPGLLCLPYAARCVTGSSTPQ